MPREAAIPWMVISLLAVGSMGGRAGRINLPAPRSVNAELDAVRPPSLGQPGLLHEGTIAPRGSDRGDQRRRCLVVTQHCETGAAASAQARGDAKIAAELFEQ